MLWNGAPKGRSKVNSNHKARTLNQEDKCSKKWHFRVLAFNGHSLRRGHVRTRQEMTWNPALNPNWICSHPIMYFQPWKCEERHSCCLYPGLSVLWQQPEPINAAYCLHQYSGSVQHSHRDTLICSRPLIHFPLLPGRLLPSSWSGLQLNSLYSNAYILSFASGEDKLENVTTKVNRHCDLRGAVIEGNLCKWNVLGEKRHLIGLLCWYVRHTSDSFHPKTMIHAFLSPLVQKNCIKLTSLDTEPLSPSPGCTIIVMMHCMTGKQVSLRPSQAQRSQEFYVKFTLH